VRTEIEKKGNTNDDEFSFCLVEEKMKRKGRENLSSKNEIDNIPSFYLFFQFKFQNFLSSYTPYPPYQTYMF